MLQKYAHRKPNEPQVLHGLGLLAWVQYDRRQLGTVNLGEPRLKQQQVPNKYTGQSIT